MLKNNDIDSAIYILKYVLKDLNKRKKIVRIADKYGWDVVQECQDDPITDDADRATIYKLWQAIISTCTKKRNNRRPFRRKIRSISGQDIQGFPGYENESDNAYSKIFDFDDCLVGNKF